MWQGCSLHTTELPTALCIVGGQDRQYAIMISGGGKRTQRSRSLLESTGVLYLLPGPTGLSPDVQSVQMQISHVAAALTDLARMLSHAYCLPELCT